MVTLESSANADPAEIRNVAAATEMLAMRIVGLPPLCCSVRDLRIAMG